MRIGINAQIVARANAGVANYAKHLVRHLARLESGHEFYVFGTPEFLATLDSSRLHLVPTHPVVQGSWRRIIWEQFALPFKARSHHLDVMFYPDHTGALLGKNCPAIITIHDLAFLAHPETFGRATRIYKTFAVKRSARRADRIIVVSQATKEECRRWLDIPEAKLRVVHNGIAEDFKRINERGKLEEARQRLGLNEKFILFVGTLEPRKNLAKLLTAYADLRRARKLEHDLIVAGAKGWLYSEIFAAVNRLALQNHVKFLGHVSQDDLVALYNLAETLVYPSLYEGFGFPPLEAMACGCPVVTSKQSSLPEIAGEAAMLVDCRDAVAIAEGIFQVIHDASLRQRLIARGHERVKQFTWPRAAKEILQVINELNIEK